MRKKSFQGSYSFVKQYSRPMRNDKKILAVYRYEADPVQFSRIDMDGKRRKLYAFSMIMRYSQMWYAEFTTDISTENVIRMHLNFGLAP